MFPPKGNLKAAIGKKIGAATAPDAPGYPGDSKDMQSLPNEAPPAGMDKGPAPMPLPGAGPLPMSKSMGSGDEVANADPADIQAITEAARNDPVIAAIARVLGLPV